MAPQVRWKDRTNSCRLSSDLYTYGCTHKTNKVSKPLSELHKCILVSLYFNFYFFLFFLPLRPSLQKGLILHLKFNLDFTSKRQLFLFLRYSKMKCTNELQKKYTREKLVKIPLSQNYRIASFQLSFASS